MLCTWSNIYFAQQELLEDALRKQEKERQLTRLPITIHRMRYSLAPAFAGFTGVGIDSRCAPHTTAIGSAKALDVFYPLVRVDAQPGDNAR